MQGEERMDHAIELIEKRLTESINVKSAILSNEENINFIRDIAMAIHKVLSQGRKVIFAGNGGSFADSIHLAAEFVSRFTMEREPLAAVSLGANNSIMTAIGNDYEFGDVFLREIKALGVSGDVFIGISTSGNSENVIRAVEAALKMGITVFCLTGKTGGRLSSLCPCLKIPSEITARIQEAHITVGHIICELVELLMFHKDT